MKLKTISYFLRLIKKMDPILLKRQFKSIISLIIFLKNSLKFLIENNCKSKKLIIKPKISMALIKTHLYSKLLILKLIAKNT